MSNINGKYAEKLEKIKKMKLGEIENYIESLEELLGIQESTPHLDSQIQEASLLTAANKRYAELKRMRAVL